jgi:uncharacterized protein
MANLAVVFVTGLTTGGLSCLAVQGGLLASSLAHQLEQAVQPPSLKRPGGRSPHLTTARISGRRAQLKPDIQAPCEGARSTGVGVSPILIFLCAKLVAYTLLGVLLGWLGTVLQLTPTLRAVMQFAIGIFMIGTALRMLHVHPVFRMFALEPPAAVTRFIRRTAKQSDGASLTPLLLGALTVLIPCGVTQAMMALALNTGSPVEGAAVMFAFTLGTSPLFFGLAYMATHLGKRMERRFNLVAAIVILVLGLLAIDGGLNLVGSPISLASLTTRSPAVVTTSQPVVAADSGTAKDASPGTVVTINALNGGYDPPVVRAVAGQAIQLDVTTNETNSCTRAFVIPALNVQEILPATGTTTIAIPPQPRGTVLRFTCSMGMFGGQIIFE